MPRRPIAAFTSASLAHFALGLALGLALARPLTALEKASPQMERDRPTSDANAVSLKPLIVFSLRGRNDPFMPYAVVTNIVKTRVFDISELVFSGTIEVDGKKAALFLGAGSKTYFLRGSSLYDPQNQPVQGIRGSIIESGDGNDVYLVQGERKLSYTSRRRSMRLDVNSPR